jgi:predicted CXXCH cytochrome family protein
LFDERIEQPAPHDEPVVVRAFVEQALRAYIATHPGDIGKPDPPSRRVPLNFPRPQEPVARTADEWVERKTARAEDLLWRRACRYCHEVNGLTASAAANAAGRPLPVIARVALKATWMPRAHFDHAPHRLVTCDSCHAAAQSRETADVLMPPAATCAVCHAPDKGAESRCFECHAYHDKTRSHPVAPRFRVQEFR